MSEWKYNRWPVLKLFCIVCEHKAFGFKSGLNDGRWGSLGSETSSCSFPEESLYRVELGGTRVYFIREDGLSSPPRPQIRGPRNLRNGSPSPQAQSVSVGRQAWLAYGVYTFHRVGDKP